MSQWTLKETICAYRESVGIPGTKSYGIDWTDSPDRYMINEIDTEPVVGMRRLFRFAGYPATQYFILAREVSHECLLSEGGKGMTYIIRSGTKVFAQKGWRLVGSFYGFDLPLKCSNKYTMFSRKVCMHKYDIDYAFCYMDLMRVVYTAIGSFLKNATMYG